MIRIRAPRLFRTSARNVAGLLDGIPGVTGAWSMSRKLLSSYTGPFYRDDGVGNTDLWYDQSGNGRDQAESSVGPTRVTVNGRTMLDFDASTDFLVRSADSMDTYINNNAGWMVVSGIFDTLTANNASSYNNNGMIGDSLGNVGIMGRSGGICYAHSWDGTDDHADGVIVAGTGYVLGWRKDATNVYLTVNSTETTALSGNILDLTADFTIGRTRQASGAFLDGKIGELITFDVVPSAAVRATIIADLKAWAGF